MGRETMDPRKATLAIHFDDRRGSSAKLDDVQQLRVIDKDVDERQKMNLTYRIAMGNKKGYCMKDNVEVDNS